MKTETYTLQRLYHEAQALIEKYQAVEDDKKLRVQFQIEEVKNVAKLNVWISYSDERYNKYTAGSGLTPTHALNDFEDELQKLSGKKLIERVALEIE